MAECVICVVVVEYYCRCCWGEEGLLTAVVGWLCYYYYCREHGKKSLPHFGDCGEARLKHWLHIHDLLFKEDIHKLQRIAVVHYEYFALGDTQG